MAVYVKIRTESILHIFWGTLCIDCQGRKNTLRSAAVSSWHVVGDSRVVCPRHNLAQAPKEPTAKMHVDIFAGFPRQIEGDFALQSNKQAHLRETPTVCQNGEDVLWRPPLRAASKFPPPSLFNLPRGPASSHFARGLRNC